MPASCSRQRCHLPFLLGIGLTLTGSDRSGDGSELTAGLYGCPGTAADKEIMSPLRAGCEVFY